MSQTLLTTAEVAARINRTPQTVRDYVKAGRLKPALKLPTTQGAYLFDPAELDRFLSEPEPSEAQ